MEKIIIQGKNLTEPQKAHEYLAGVMDFPEYYGGNLDALYDCLTDICDESLVCIEYDGDDLESEYFHMILGVFIDAVAYNKVLRLQFASYGGYEFDF